MGVGSRQVSVLTTPTLLVGATPSPKTVIIGGASLASVHIGGPDVTTANGVHGDHMDGVSIRLGQDDALYAVHASGTDTVEVLIIS
jgi:hypothetical protein